MLRGRALVPAGGRGWEHWGLLGQREDGPLRRTPPPHLSRPAGASGRSRGAPLHLVEGDLIRVGLSGDRSKGKRFTTGLGQSWGKAQFPK